MPVAKLSVTIADSDLDWVKAEAKRLKLSVSAVIADAVAQKRALRAQGPTSSALAASMRASCAA
jgi:hypothetical protein